MRTRPLALDVIVNTWIRYAVALMSTLSLTSCFATYSYRTAETTLCQSEAGSDWHGRDTSIGLKRDGVEYAFRVDDLGSKNANIHGSEDKFWIRIDAATFGRAAGYRAPEMVFDPREAVIEIDGRRIAALAQLWEADVVNGYYRPVKEVPIPANLNLLGRAVPTSFFIGFSMPDPGTRSTYRFHPGSIVLDGVRTQLPAFSSCYKQGKGGWTPIH